ncbi:hypothetical protein [Nocardioides marmorisolisilvae]|uniref:DUF2269 family protein n=1 Tax=Nocardioides marmorisolisilvae TaxID=1542737 RepID=A0A3N0DSJ5_9ACTN|nr:hypothetical protein [Nocardioides marmorisolisilvae]RNL78600.1 hypothetical protein EFL95_05800 [Nocardioides marmorisolisilvae]
MFKIFLALHLLAAVFAIGPLVHATTTASRGLRTGDGAATAASARIATLYSYASVGVIVFGFGLMSMDNPYGPGKVADMGDPFIWGSLVLWLVALGLTLGVIVPTLQQATVNITNGVGVDGLTARVASCGGLVGLIFAAIIFLMVYKPGS